MMRRTIVSLTLALVASLALAWSALAGGWAAVSLDHLPTEIRAGQALTLGFMVRQHGITPNGDTQSLLIANNKTTGETLNIPARNEGVTGHYVVDVTFPSAGEWAWEIRPRPFDSTKFEPVIVLPALAATSPQPSRPTLVPVDADTLRLGLRGLGVVVLLGAVILAVLRRRETLRPAATTSGK